MAKKATFSPIVVKHIRDRYNSGETQEFIANSITEETGYVMSRHKVRDILFNDDCIADPND